MKKTSLALLSLSCVFAFDFAFGKTTHSLCTDSAGRKLYAVVDGENLGFTVEGTTGTHAALLKASSKVPHRYIGTSTNLKTADPVWITSHITYNDDTMLKRIDFKINQSDREAKSYHYTCSPKDPFL